MAIDVISADATSGADRRDAARIVALQYLAMRAAARRDTRVEGTRNAGASRSTPAERAATNNSRIVDILA